MAKQSKRNIDYLSEDEDGAELLARSKPLNHDFSMYKSAKATLVLILNVVLILAI